MPTMHTATQLNPKGEQERRHGLANVCIDTFALAGNHTFHFELH
jgi:hypothetical protein